MLYISSLNSGSNGNCYYIGNDKEAVLIDAGISCRETEKRMKQTGLDIRKVKAIFISHEHSDHIKGVVVLAQKYSLPVYITAQTLKAGFITKAKQHIKKFSSNETIQIGSLLVKAFSKNHDALDPHSFLVSYKKINIGVFTDIGNACSNVTSHFAQCHAAFLEANYDDAMLQQGSYPTYLKKRISGEKGHLSNVQALQIFIQYRSSSLSHLLLSHLSKENNCPKLVQELFEKNANGKTRITVASRYEPTGVFSIGATKKTATRICNRPVQLALWESALA